MTKDRIAKINGELRLEEDCNLEELVKDLFACLDRYNVTHNIRICESLDSEEYNTGNQAIHDRIKKRLEKDR